MAVVVMALACNGCATTTETTSPRSDATQALIDHPQFIRAVDAAPKFVSDTFLTITRLEAELDRANARR